jgi:hypothetical protein
MGTEVTPVTTFEDRALAIQSRLGEHGRKSRNKNCDEERRRYEQVKNPRDWRDR